MRLRWAFGLLIVMVFLCSVASAEDSPEATPEANSNPSDAKAWDFSLAPLYLWAASVDGNMTVKGIEVDMNLPFKDVLEDLDGALSFHFEAVHNQRAGIFADLMYLRLTPSKDKKFIGSIDIEYEELLAELGGFYRYTSGAHTIDGLGGLRYSSMKGELDIGPLPTIDQSVDWLDPFFGLRWRCQMAEKWALRLRGDLGGFGFGTDIAWNLVGLIEFKPWKHVSFGGGYRALYQDYSKGKGRNKFEYEATMYGPILGLEITW